MMQSLTWTDDQVEADRLFGQLLVLRAAHLRNLAKKLCGNASDAEDLAQETLAQAWRARCSFRLGTNLEAWLYTILRNRFYSNLRKSRRQRPWDEDTFAMIPNASDKADWVVTLSETIRAIRSLPRSQRVALMAVGAGGASYEEAALICNCAEGTVKSRVTRGRAALRRGVTAPGASYPCTGYAIEVILDELECLLKDKLPRSSIGKAAGPKRSRSGERQSRRRHSVAVDREASPPTNCNVGSRILRT